MKLLVVCSLYSSLREYCLNDLATDNEISKILYQSRHELEKRLQEITETKKLISLIDKKAKEELSRVLEKSPD